MYATNDQALDLGREGFRYGAILAVLRLRNESCGDAATVCFLDDFEACIAHLWMPVRHRKATRTTNRLERLFGEEWRRTKVFTNARGREGGPEADVHGSRPGLGEVAADRGHRLRAAADGAPEEGTRRGVQGREPTRLDPKTGTTPLRIIQQVRELARCRWSRHALGSQIGTSRT